MPFQIVRNDITKMRCDAIVNAANSSLLGGGGVDGAIHRAAGPRLLEACKTLGGCKVGEAKLTWGYDLPARYVIHTVGPRWFGGNSGEPDKLASCYRESLRIAKDFKCESVAFPLISAGAYGYPRDKALQVATSEITSFLLENDMTVYLVVFDRDSFNLSSKLMADVTEYVDENYVGERMAAESRRRPEVFEEETKDENDLLELIAMFEKREPSSSDNEQLLPPISVSESLADLSAPTPEQFELDESFSEMLLRKIDESGMTDAQCYKKANIDRKLFSKIRSDPHYRPSKPTVVAFAIALELGLDETRELLEKAGYALSRSIKFDVIIEYFVKNRRYDVFEINEVLFEFDQVLLGA